MLAIVGQQARAALGGDYQQEVDLTTLFKDVASEYVHMATVPEQMRHLIDRGIRIALSERTPTCLIVPNDLASEKAVDASSRPWDGALLRRVFGPDASCQSTGICARPPGS